jgi:hypothetical protein
LHAIISSPGKRSVVCVSLMSSGACAAAAAAAADVAADIRLMTFGREISHRRRRYSPFRSSAASNERHEPQWNDGDGWMVGWMDGVQRDEGKEGEHMFIATSTRGHRTVVCLI